MRLALILPAQIEGWGGVQRFGACLEPALASIAEVSAYRLHPAPGASRLAAFGTGVRDLGRDHRRQQFDAVVSTFHWPPRLLGVPMVGVVHDLRRRAGAQSGSPAAHLERAILRTWDLVLVPSEHVRDEVASFVGERTITVIGEGTDHLDHLAPPPAERRLVVVLGGRAPHKRVELGVRAAAEAVARLDADGVVLGAAPHLRMGSRIRVLEAAADEEIAAVLSRARVVLAPSRYEGFGLAAGEALRLGAPVVFAADGPLAGLVGGGGLPAAPTASAMADATVAAWRRHDALSVAARDAVRQMTWDATARRIVREVGFLVQDPPLHPRKTVRGLFRLRPR